MSIDPPYDSDDRNLVDRRDCGEDGFLSAPRYRPSCHKANGGAGGSSFIPFVLPLFVFFLLFLVFWGDGVRDELSISFENGYPGFVRHGAACTTRKLSDCGQKQQALQAVLHEKSNRRQN